MNDKAKWRYRTWREQERKPEKSEWMNENVPKVQSYIVFVTIHLLHCVILRAFAVFQIKSLVTVFEGNWFLCQVVAQMETCSQCTPMIGVY